MQCPSCGKKQASKVECEHCGIIFAKYQKRQQRLADEKKARQEQASQKKKKSIPGVAVGLIVGLMVGGGAFYFYGSKSKIVEPSANLAVENLHEDITNSNDKKNVRTKPNVTKFDRQNPSNSLEGLAMQLNESHPADTPIEKARNATVFIQTSWGSGSGFFVSANGLIITNKHVLQMQEKDLQQLTANADKGARLLAREEKNIRYLRSKVPQVRDREMRQQLQEDIRGREQEYAKYKSLHEGLLEKLSDIESASPRTDVEVVLVDGSRYSVDSVTMSDNYDLALLSVNAYGAPYLSISRGPKDQGMKVYTVGNPHGLRHTVTAGIVSGYRSYNGTRLLQTDAPINPGNSGGPLVDEAGRVLGVNTMIIRGTEGIGFAIPMKSVLEEFGSYISVD